MDGQIIKTSAPGRICLFGEHQDYLNLPIIACAISKRIYIEGTKRKDTSVVISLPDISSGELFDLNGKINYTKEREYFRSAVNVLLREGYIFPAGYECTVHGDIPINAGTSSSSALIVAWIKFLIEMSGNSLIVNAEKIAELAHKAEVIEFSEPGGMMDHYSTSVGGTIWLNPFPAPSLKKIRYNFGPFVLGNSGEPKNTTFVLANVKNRVLDLISKIKLDHPEFSIQKVSVDEINSKMFDLSCGDLELLKGTVSNRDITYRAYDILDSVSSCDNSIGDLLNAEQEILRSTLKISTAKIDSMISASLDAGAAGAKINGSGGGGCMFAYAPGDPHKVLDAVKKFTDEAYIIYPDEGVRIENGGAAQL